MEVAVEVAVEVDVGADVEAEVTRYRCGDGRDEAKAGSRVACMIFVKRGQWAGWRREGRRKGLEGR